MKKILFIDGQMKGNVLGSACLYYVNLFCGKEVNISGVKTLVDGASRTKEESFNLVICLSMGDKSAQEVVDVLTQQPPENTSKLVVDFGDSFLYNWEKKILTEHKKALNKKIRKILSL